MKFHLGCGNIHFNGYINIDWRKTQATDLVCDVRKLACRDNSVSLVETYHLIEHLPKHNLLMALKDWHRAMKPKAKLIIECPDFDRAVQDYLNGNEQRLNNIFGLQRFEEDFHFFGYNSKRLKRILEYVGFQNVESKEPQDYHAKQEPCLRMECDKK